ncbi:MAG TPA: ABC transporter ATP-binding protein [Bacillota bacterium]|nr:ABC transporter ATP-binding protein [Bacillota bacterium]
MPPVLEVKDLSAFIGPFHVLQGVSLEVHAGETAVVLGRNGAGKTTTLRTIMGLIPVAGGRIALEGASLAGLPSHRIARLGVGYVPEDRGIFDLLTVEENLQLGMMRRDRAAIGRRDHVLDLFPDLRIAYRRLASTLSGGQRQMLAIARAFLNDSRVVLIDEPSKGLAPIVVDRVRDAILEIKEHRTIVLVEQNFALASAVGDRYFILNQGMTVDHGPMAGLLKDRELLAKHLGMAARP